MMQDYTYYRGLRSGVRGVESGRKATPKTVPRQSQFQPARQHVKYKRKEATWLEPISELAAVGPSADF
jgi:hypothetical protein